MSEPINLLDAALAYHCRGWSVIPTIGKKAAGPWKSFQEKPADEATLRRMFAEPNVTGLAVVLGAVSGGLACRDYDQADAYHAWVAAHPDLAAILPTVKTARGFHVYHKTAFESYITLPDGEYRADSGHYCLVPPARHPDGTIYAWTVPLPDGELVELDGDMTGRREPKMNGSALSTNGKPSVWAMRNGNYGRTALSREYTKLASTPAGARNDQLFRSAAALYELVAGGELTEADVEASLVDAAAQCGLLADGESAVRATIASGRAAGIKNPRRAPERNGKAHFSPVLVEAAEPDHTIDDATLEAAPEVDGPPPSEDPPPEAQAPEAALLTDLGNGQRFAREHGDIVRFVHPWGKWLIWDGTRWRIDDAGRAMALAKETIVKMFTWAKLQIELLSKDESEEAAIRAKRIKAVLDFALKSQHVNRLKAMLDLARSEPGIPILPDALDRDPMLLNVANGTLDLRTGELRSHRQEDYLTKLCPVAYDAEAECPIFEATVFGIFASDGELIEHVMRFFGYCMTGEVRDDIFAILHGNGSNGKSLLLKIILDVLGSDYGGTVPPELLMDMHGDSHPTLKADLFGKRLMVAFETGDGAKLNESRIKAITSIDDQKARRMREDYWSFKPTHKLLLCTNHKPRITGDDHGIWRRIALWPFNQKFWDADKSETGPAELRADKKLKDKLQAERAGILAWLVRGCLAWQRDGLRVPRVVLDATAEYRSNEDRLGSFLSERCELNREFRAKSSEVYGAYKAWADANGERPMTAQAFGRTLRERGIELDTGRRWYLGIALSTGE